MAYAWKAAQAKSGGASSAAPFSGFVAAANASNASAAPDTGKDTGKDGEDHPRGHDDGHSDVASSNGDDD